ncbi:hypothetical protein N9135_01815 [Akkermansiaceae bacterium]|nr:hypothetical protein [Akkermansiaceae bacterium]
MDPTTGAHQHIRVGIRELSKHFSVIPFLPVFQKQKALVTSQPVAGVSVVKRGGLYGALRDCRDFFRLTRQAWVVAAQVKGVGCSLAYVRVQGLSPVSLFLKWRGVDVFLEANGLQFESRKRRFTSAMSCLYRPFERWVYSSANHVFFVGSYGDYWKLPTDNWTNVENGIESELLEIKALPKSMGPPFRLCLLARLVGHHQVGVLIDAIKSLESQVAKKIELHLIGSGFDYLISECAPFITVVDHGFQVRGKLPKLLQTMHAGIIPGVPKYQSQMKLFDYAVNGCLVIAPRTFHLENCFGGKGICFFEPGSSSSLMLSLSAIVNASGSDGATKLYQSIKKDYTWDNIFSRKVKIIKKRKL